MNEETTVCSHSHSFEERDRSKTLGIPVSVVSSVQQFPSLSLVKQIKSALRKAVSVMARLSLSRCVADGHYSVEGHL